MTDDDDDGGVVMTVDVMMWQNQHGVSIVINGDNTSLACWD